MICMTEKIYRLKLKGCETQLSAMTEELRAHREEFLLCPELLDFDREWMERYIG